MIALFKAIFPGAFLSWLVATFVGTEGSPGGLLNIQHYSVHGTTILFSWVLFLIGTALAWALLKMME